MSGAEISVYFDSNVLIYAMETDGEYGTLARRWMMQIDRGLVSASTSELTILEVLPHPIASSNDDLVDGYRRLLGGASGLTMIAVTTKILFDAARLRAELGITAADSIHVATALDHGCQRFLTNDERLQLPRALIRQGLAQAMGLYP